jgi:cyclopropane-fatty-acyl-phospholipid synthase
MSSAILSLTRKVSIYETVFLRLFEKMPYGRLVVELPDGKHHRFGNGEGVHALIRVSDTDFFMKCSLYGDVGFAESYIDGDWSTDSIANIVTWFILNINHNPVLSGKGLPKYFSNFLTVFNKLYHKTRRNTIEGSRKNISEHYDLGNNFYKLFLDETMTYSSGIFRTPDMSLKAAQDEKYDRLCREINLVATDHVLEIGSGWGGFATHAARHYGCRVTTVTISEQQFAYTQERILREGLEDKISVHLQDYRTLEGSFDKIVSIEMLEAVGHKYLPTYFRKCNELLKPAGRLALQVITSQDKRYHEHRKNVDFIQKHIFPGSQTPSFAYIHEVVSKVSDLNLYDMKDIGLDYARTLRMWSDYFNHHLQSVRNLGMSESFIRKWNYYLQYCEAGFATRHVTVKQLIYTRPYA